MMYISGTLFSLPSGYNYMQRIERSGQSIGPDIEIFGTGQVGDKAAQLVRKTPLLQSIGFFVPPRIMLAQNYLDGYIRTGNIDDDLKYIITHAVDRFGQSPVIVRSSAMSDARGTGTYASEFTVNTEEGIAKAFKKVVDSYFTESAIAFRRDANAGEGFGILVEPLIGQKLNDHYLAPILSGFGYTSTSRSEGYVVMVPGLGGGVETRDGERIMKSEIEKVNYKLEEHLSIVRNEMSFGIKQWRRTPILRTDPHHLMGGYEGQAFDPVDGRVEDTTLFFEGHLSRVLHDLNLRPMFEMLETLEKSVGKPQYFEWAMTIEKSHPVYWIMQVADISKRLDIFEFGGQGETLFMGHTVTGSGIKECTKIVNCWNFTDIDALHLFNENNRNYILLFSSRLTSKGVQARKLQYEDYNNASVFLEIQDAPHADINPVSHLSGQLDVTGKFFGVLDYDAVIPPNWDSFNRGKKSDGGIDVFEGKIKVISSERQNRLALFIHD